MLRRFFLDTSFVLALINKNEREMAGRVLDALRSSAGIRVEPSSPELFEKAFALLRARVVECYELQNALTPDRHFQQAGFRAVLLER